MTLQGMDALKRAFVQTPDRLKDHLSQTVAVTTFAIAQAVRAQVPRGATGVLAANIFSSSRGMVGRVEIGLPAFYWHYLEFGTVKMAARPFIRPAAEQESSTFERRLVGIAREVEQDFARAA